MFDDIFIVLIYPFIYRRMNSILDKIWKCVQDRRHAPQKPAIFPIASLGVMDAFERIEEDKYSNTVSRKFTFLYIYSPSNIQLH